MDAFWFKAGHEPRITDREVMSRRDGLDSMLDETGSLFIFGESRDGGLRITYVP